MANDSLPVALTSRALTAASPEAQSLVAAKAATPKPSFTDPQPATGTYDNTAYGEEYACKLEYMFLGSLLGCIGTLIYYNGARLHQRFLQSRGRAPSAEEETKEDPNSFLVDQTQKVLFDCDEEKDDLMRVSRRN